jgi:general secretion pathway protein G
MRKRRYAQGGVTLIEMLVVVTIISLIAGVVGISVLKYLDKAKVDTAKHQIAEFETACDAYKIDVGTYPSTEQGLQALRVKPSDVTNWDHAYLSKDIPLDPWHHPYIYKFPGEHGEEPDIVSYGQDGQPGGEGLNADIVSWK